MLDKPRDRKIKLCFSLVMLTFLEIVYWGAVLAGAFTKQQWTNFNPDTWIHGCLSGGALMAVVCDWIEFAKSRRRREEVGDAKP